MSRMACTTQMQLPGSVAPDARIRAPWSRAMAPVSAGMGLGSGSSFAYVTTGTHRIDAELNIKAHGARRLLETPS